MQHAEVGGVMHVTLWGHGVCVHVGTRCVHVCRDPVHACVQGPGACVHGDLVHGDLVQVCAGTCCKRACVGTWCMRACVGTRCVHGDPLRACVGTRCMGTRCKCACMGTHQPRQSFLPTSSRELEMTSNRKLQVGPSQQKSTNSRSRAWAHLYKLPHVVGGPIS